MLKSCSLVVWSFLALLISSASAQEFAACAALTDADERLACYDALTAEVAQAAQVADAAPARRPRSPNYYLVADRVAADAAGQLFKFSPHRATYILFASFTEEPNRAPYLTSNPDLDLDRVETKFQLSFKTKLIDDPLSDNFDLWFGYTQLSFWQIYNTDDSAPFRESNYEPEFWSSFVTDLDLFGLRLRQVDLGIAHQSNGRSEPLSRSWNRVYLNLLLNRGKFALSFKPWLRLQESEAADDNPDIEDYLGNFELRAFYYWPRSSCAVMVRNNLDLDDNHGAVQLDWIFPIYQSVDGYVQYFYGYGDGLIDYNYRNNRLGAGVMLLNWL